MIKNNTKESIEGENKDVEILLKSIFEKYGYDFRDYSRAHIKRRILRRVNALDLKSIRELEYKILESKEEFNFLLEDFSINVTDMFRDPSFYKSFREEVVPILKTYPFIRIWHAGCSTGEEVYSMAILLKEEGLYDRSQIYATDFNEHVLKKAKEGIYDTDLIKDYAENYEESGGKASFSDYYKNHYNEVKINESLKRKIIFADHNLVTDGIFGEMHVIICRNVLIYFNKKLQNRTLNLFYESLIMGGFLCLGSKESIKFTDIENKFHNLVEKENIFQKKLIID